MMRLLSKFIALVVLESAYSYGTVSFSAYTLISRTDLASCGIVSLAPKGWLANVAKVIPAEKKVRISEVIWLPCPYSLTAMDDFESVTDDDSLASRLCDRGYLVHAVEPKNGQTFSKALIDAVTWRVKEQKVPGREIAIVANELTTVHLLNYLSEVALPMTASRVDVGAIVLIDPPPIHSLYTKVGKRNILSRYIEPIKSVPLEVLEPPRMPVLKTKPKSRRQRDKDREQWQDFLHPTRSKGKVSKELEEQRGYYQRVKRKGLVGSLLIQYSQNVKENEEKEVLMPTSSVEELDADLLALIEKLGNEDGNDDSEEEEEDEDGAWDYEREIKDEDNTPLSAGSINEDIVLGRYPSKIVSTAEALRNRMLVINSQFPSEVGESAEEWGARAIEDLAAIYNAGPVLHLLDDDNDDDDSEGEEFSLLLDNESKVDSKEGVGDDKNDYEEKERHQKLADTISDWLYMLTQFNYL